MSKKFPFLTEVVIGVLLTGAVAWSYLKKSAVLQTASLKTYDLLLTNFRANTIQDPNIVLVEIDEESVSHLGRWPWPRPMVAQLVDEVVAGGARVIGLNILYNEPDRNQGLEEIARLETAFKEILTKNRSVLAKKKSALDDFEAFLTDEMEQSRAELDGDTVLAQTIEQATNVILPMYFQPGEALGLPEALPAYFEKEKLGLKGEPLPPAPAGNAAALPMENFAGMALAVGHSNVMQDPDGTLRRLAPTMKYGASYYPSFGLQLLRENLRLQRDAVVWKPGDGLTLHNARIPLDEEGMTYLQFAKDRGSFKRFSAVEVMAGGTPEGALANKIVIIGVTAPGLAQTFVGPSGDSYTDLELWATHMSNILAKQFIQRPGWAPSFEWGTIALAGLIVILILPFVRARFAIPAALLIGGGMAGASGYLFSSQGLWASPAYGLGLLLAGFIGSVGKRLIFTERGKELVEAEGVETNKMLGLSFQGQGMLDLAFEKFRRCPVDNQMKDLLYNLALDMERKRQFSKAAAVYEHVAAADPKYKDVQEKIELLKKAGEGAVFGGLGKKGNDATVVVEGLGQYTTLGRYEVVRELGRGAMGIVYLGRDPKINRQVAIKTLRFEDTVDEDQAKSLKERFFREAQSAGNLTHPNIIRIFDAGEDQDVAYIAMELLEGEDLKKYCDKAALLPPERVLEMVQQVASALDYAHKQGVVHRDIKPANIMLLKDGTLRITDFGIARLMATSKTATGAVLGTPAYMSPEQVNGSKKVDGRADIFSLGVTLYEMLSGDKPFFADSIAALLYRIANVEHTDIREFNRNVNAGVIPIINKALAKDPANRFQTAGEMAEALHKLITTGNSGVAPVPPAAQPAIPDAGTVQAEQPAVTVPAPAPSPEEPAVTDAADVSDPLSKTGFLNELEQAFNIVPDATSPPTNGMAAAPEPAAVENTVSEKTAVDFRVVQNNESIDAIEKTVVNENKKYDNPPVSPAIEGGFQPPIPAKEERKNGEGAA